MFFFSDFMSDFKTDDDFLDQSMDFGDLPPDPEAVRGFFYELLFLFYLNNTVHLIDHKQTGA